MLFLKETDSCMQYEEQAQLLHDLLKTERHRAKVISLLIGKLKRVRMYLALKPADVSVILGNNPEMIRKFWYEDFILFASSTNVYVEMLRAKMIPKSEIKESLEMFLKHEYKRSAFYVDSPENFNVLKENKALFESIKGTFPYTLENRLKGEIFKEEENKKQYFESITRLDLEDFLDLA